MSEPTLADLLELLKRSAAVGAIESRHYEFCIASDNCKCLDEASALERMIEALSE